MNAPLFVLADHYHQASQWARDNGLSPGEWIYAFGPHQVLGRRDGRYVLITADGALPVEGRADVLEALRMAGFRHIDEGGG